MPVNSLWRYYKGKIQPVWLIHSSTLHPIRAQPPAFTDLSLIYTLNSFSLVHFFSMAFSNALEATADTEKQL